MNSMITWFESHEKLAGWAQFFGAVIALAVTYFTAFVPTWQRKRQLRNASNRLLAHGYEVLESFYRTTGYFLPHSMNVKAGILAIKTIVNEINKFPIYELEDQGVHSTARRLVAVSGTLEGTCFFLEEISGHMGENQMSEEDRDLMRDWVKQRLDAVAALLTGAPLERPDPSDFLSGNFKS